MLRQLTMKSKLVNLLSSITRNKAVVIKCGKNKNHYLKYDSSTQRMVATENEKEAQVVVLKDPGYQVIDQSQCGKGYPKVYIGDAVESDGTININGNYSVVIDGDDKYVEFSDRDFDATTIDNTVFIQRVYDDNNQDFKLSWVENPGEDNEEEHFLKFNEDDLSIQVDASENDEDSRFKMVDKPQSDVKQWNMKHVFVTSAGVLVVVACMLKYHMSKEKAK